MWCTIAYNLDSDAERRPDPEPRTEVVTTIAPETRVRASRPAWSDAAGNRYRPGENHGRTGVVVGPALDEAGRPYRVGADVIVDIRWDDDGTGFDWSSALRRI